MATRYIGKVSDLQADRVFFRVEGFRGTAAVGTTTNIDWPFPEERWMTGGILLASGTHWGDKLSVQVVDKDNILGLGADYVVVQPVKDFYVVTDSQFQIDLSAPYTALVPAGLYVRIAYTNTSLLDPVEVALNLVTHIPRA